jgi:hypothetical protein
MFKMWETFSGYKRQAEVIAYEAQHGDDKRIVDIFKEFICRSNYTVCSDYRILFLLLKKIYVSDTYYIKAT